MVLAMFNGDRSLVLLVVLSLCMASVPGGCAKFTAPYEPGRIFFFADIDPSKNKPDIKWAPGGGTPVRGHFAVRYHIEGEDPVLLEFVQEEVYKRGYFDLVGRAIEGGEGSDG